MSPASNRYSRIALIAQLLFLIVVIDGGASGATPLNAVSPRGQVVSDPGGVGGVPYAGHARVKVILTAGMVLNSRSEPISGVAIVVLSATGAFVDSAVTNTDGSFVCALPEISGLDLSAPAFAVYGIPVHAGEPVLVVLP